MKYHFVVQTRLKDPVIGYNVARIVGMIMIWFIFTSKDLDSITKDKGRLE